MEKNQNFTVVEAAIGYFFDLVFLFLNFLFIFFPQHHRHFAHITKDTIKLGVRLEPRMLGEYAEQLLQKSEVNENMEGNDRINLEQILTTMSTYRKKKKSKICTRSRTSKLQTLISLKCLTRKKE